MTYEDGSMLRRHLGNIDENLERDTLEHTFGAAGFEIQTAQVIGTEWRDTPRSEPHPVSRALLRLARLRRQRDPVISSHGQDLYDHIEANLHWEVFQFLGKLEPIVYTLFAASPP